MRQGGLYDIAFSFPEELAHVFVRASSRMVGVIKIGAGTAMKNIYVDVFNVSQPVSPVLAAIFCAF